MGGQKTTCYEAPHFVIRSVFCVSIGGVRILRVGDSFRESLLFTIEQHVLVHVCQACELELGENSK